MSATVYRITTMLSSVLHAVPTGTNLGLFHLLWTLLSGRFLASRGAVIPALAETGLPTPAVRRAWAALAGGHWEINALLTRWQQWVQREGQWQPRCHGGYRPVAADLVGFFRPRLQDCPSQHYSSPAGKALPALPFGMLARIGAVGEQRLPLPVRLLRVGADGSEAALQQRLVQEAATLLAPAEALIVDGGFPLSLLLAAGVPRFVVRVPKNFTARRATRPEYGGRGRPGEYGTLIRPLARSYKERLLPATPPDREDHFLAANALIRVQVWEQLVLAEAKPGAPTFTCLVFFDPRYPEPLVVATPLAAPAAVVYALYRDRWSIEQWPLSAKQMVGAARQFVFAPESRQRLPELALLAGAILSYVAATEPAHSTGFWDRRPRPTAGRLRRALARVDFQELGSYPPPFGKRRRPPRICPRACSAIDAGNAPSLPRSHCHSRHRPPHLPETKVRSTWGKATSEAAGREDGPALIPRVELVQADRSRTRVGQARILALLVLLLAAIPSAALARSRVDLLRVDGVISPAAAMYIRRGIDNATGSGAAAVLIELDTPGGLMKSMDEITRAMLQSPVPVIVYVSPSGARAASAGVFIVYAAHVAAMAPTTHLGAATPVFSGGQEGPEGDNQRTLRRKVTEDAVAGIRTIARRRHRNAAWAEQAVRQAVSLPAEDAVREHVVDLLASDPDDLLRRVDGREVELPDGPRILHTAGAEIVPVGMEARERFLDILADPNIGLILMTLAIYGLIIELSHPGAIFPGVVGGIGLILALASFATLQVNYAGVALIGFAVLLFLADLFLPAHGILSVGGVISFILGALLLTSGRESYLQVSTQVVLTLAMMTGGFFVFVVGTALRAQRRRPAVGREALVGSPGVARTDLKPIGMVFAKGELWSAEAVDEPMSAGERVRVVGAEGLKLWVRKENGE